MSLRSHSSLRTTIFTAVIAFTVLALSAPASQAGVLVNTAVSCDAYTFEQPFLRWNDSFDYVLAPNGGFERAANQWTLLNGARVVPGNEPYYVHRRTDSRSLALPVGSRAKSRSMCVGLDHPTLRFFARNRGEPTSVLRVDVMFEDAAGNVQTLTIGTTTGSESWEPALPMPVVANLLPLLPNERTAVAFRFAPLDNAGAWQIDDVYVDPYKVR
jgi:hypothetical protein